MSDDETPHLADELSFPHAQDAGDHRWIVLYPEDYSNTVRDVEGNVGLKLNIQQASELLALTAETIGTLSIHENDDGDDVIEHLINRLQDIKEDDDE